MTIEPEDLRDVDMFRAVDEVALRELAEHCRRIELMAGATLFEQNSPSDALYVLETGQIHILRQYEDGEHVVLATEVPWYVIGDLSMLAAQPRTGAVEAVSDCTLIALQRSAFFTLCKQHIGLALAVQEQLAQRLFRMNLRARENAIGNMAARVASLLLLMAGDRPENPLTPTLARLSHGPRHGHRQRCDRASAGRLGRRGPDSFRRHASGRAGCGTAGEHRRLNGLGVSPAVAAQTAAAATMPSLKVRCRMCSRLQV